MGRIQQQSEEICKSVRHSADFVQQGSHPGPAIWLRRTWPLERAAGFHFYCLIPGIWIVLESLRKCTPLTSGFRWSSALVDKRHILFSRCRIVQCRKGKAITLEAEDLYMQFCWNQFSKISAFQGVNWLSNFRYPLTEQRRKLRKVKGCGPQYERQSVTRPTYSLFL